MPNNSLSPQPLESTPGAQIIPFDPIERAAARATITYLALLPYHNGPVLSREECTKIVQERLLSDRAWEAQGLDIAADPYWTGEVEINWAEAEEPPPPPEPANDVNTKPWPEPLPLVAAPAPVPPFPLQALPRVLRDYTGALAESLQVPLELPVFAVMGVLSACVARRYVVYVRPDWEDEPLNMYWFVALESGERKSPVVSRVTRPLVKFERNAVRKHKKEIEGLELQVSGSKLDPENDELKAKLDSLRRQGPERLLTDDVTAERLAGLMAEQGGCMAIITDEGGVLDVMAGRYNKGPAPNVDIYLKAFSGGTIRVDRNAKDSKTGVRDSFSVDKPALTMVLCVQPVKLKDLLKLPGGRAVGLLARFNFARPKSMVGYQNSDPPPVPTAVSDAYEALVGKLLVVGGEGEEGELPALRFSTEARAMIVGLLDSTTVRMRPGGDLNHLQDWANKFPGRVVRIAGTLHLAEMHSEDSEDSEGGPLEISASTVLRAIEIGKWLLANALDVFPPPRTSGPVGERANIVLAWIKRQIGNCDITVIANISPSTFSHRDVHQALKGTTVFKESSSLDEPLRLLEQLHYIRAVDDTEPARAGRPSQRYEVNPLLSISSQSSE